MTETNATATSVEVMWRPGCPLCGSLRRGLQRAGVLTTEHDIWASASAAARVRDATGGDETVPTVFVGGQALVNPSVRQVIEAIRGVDPNYRPESTSAGRSGSVGEMRPLSAGAMWMIVAALVWALLAAWRPTTTWHLAPLIVAAAWPWIVGQDTPTGDLSARRRIMRAGAGGLLSALALTTVLFAAGRLQGPTVTGSGNPAVEALLLSGMGAVIATAMGVLRTARRTTVATARLGTSHVATSEDIVTVEGNAYFPLRSVPDGVLHPSNTTSVCPWKGIASYYDVHVDGRVVPDGAFTYRHPSPLARRIKGRVAFWNGIQVDTRHPEQTTAGEPVPGQSRW